MTEEAFSRLQDKYDLTDQQVEICRYVCKGYSNGEIGTRLFVCEKTVKDHLNKIFKAVGIQSPTKGNRTALIYLIAELGKPHVD